MKLTPLDIKKQEFKNTFRGYDPLEVETFLEMVAAEYEELLNERNQYKDEIQILQTQLKDYKQIEQTLKQTLMNAQESVNKARTNTEKEANLIIHEAELKAEKILEKSRHDLESMKNELILIRSQKESFAKRLRYLLESQIELIKVLEIDDIGYEGKDERVKPDTNDEIQKLPLKEKEKGEEDSFVDETESAIAEPEINKTVSDEETIEEIFEEELQPKDPQPLEEDPEKGETIPSKKDDKKTQKESFPNDDQMVF